MVGYSHLWSAIHTYGRLFTPMVSYSHLWSAIHTYGRLFTPMVGYSHLWSAIHTYGRLSIPIEDIRPRVIHEWVMRRTWQNSAALTTDYRLPTTDYRLPTTDN